MLSIRTSLASTLVLLVALAPAHAGSDGLGFPDAGASIRQLNKTSVNRFNNSAAKVRRTQQDQYKRRKSREEAFTKARKDRQRKENLERELRQR